VRVLSDAAVCEVLDLEALLPAVEAAFVAQGRGAVERPERPHFPVGAGLGHAAAGPPSSASDAPDTSSENGDTGDSGPEPLGTALAMPAYVHGAAHYVTKLASVHPSNPPERPTVHAQVVLVEAATGRPAAFLAGTRLTNARTACVGGLAARDLAVDEPLEVGVVGAGAQARWQARAIATAADVAGVRLYSPTPDSRTGCARDLRDRGIDARAVETPRAAVAAADVVVTATTASEPTFPADALAPGALVVAVGAYTAETQELAPAVFDRAARAFADVPGAAATTGDCRAAGVGADDLIPFSDVPEGVAGREWPEEVLLVTSVGSAVLDAAAGEHLLERAVDADVGTVVDLT